MNAMPPRNRPVYLDNHATTPCDPRVVEAMLPWFNEKFGNPHSAEHRLGQEAEAAVEAAREAVATLIGAEAREIVLTSGATESNNIAIKGAARFAAAHDNPRRRIVTVATEHKCVLESVADLAAEGFEPVVLPVRPDGLLDLATLHAAVDEATLLVSVMAVNNEIGVTQDLAAIGRITKEAGALFHTDAAQAAGKIPLNVNALGIDLASISGHKLYGPKGVGALYVRRRPRARLAPLFSGGGQERGLRSGTLPAPLIVGFGEACQIAAAGMAEEAKRLTSLRDRLWSGLAAAIPGITLNGSSEARIPGNLNVTFPGRTAEALMRACPDLCVSTGSACSSAAVEPSYVLTALGLPPDAAARTLRLGLGRFTSEADVDYAVAALAAAHRGAEAA
ncbi:cysteine desulfurase family protein [Elioraea rosea]|uniref:cysteine desulfurase family protein n=1 Tax=Elioraea rosea TaxID=2492390 RepID=UPI0011866AE4|nr:aminotransferase class V-fold PLP-dependent enzyme [Elioraea rosea]